MVRQAALISVWLLLIGSTGGCEDTGSAPTSGDNQLFSEAIARAFAFGDTATVDVESFVGNVTIRPGGSDSIRINATKRAAASADLGLIEFTTTEQEGEIRIRAENPANRPNASIDIDITAPPGARMDVGLGVGNISYTGRAGGENRFAAGVGSIILVLPANVNIKVELAAGSGSITLEFAVVGQITTTTVNGTIGTGNEGRIQASVGVGEIRLVRG